MNEAHPGKDHSRAPSAVPDASLEVSTPGDTLRDSWRRILILSWTHLMAHRRHGHIAPLRVWFLAIVLITARCVLNTKLSYAPMAVSKPNANSTVLDSFFERISNGTSELRPYSHLNEALTSVERGDDTAMIRVGQNSSTDAHYRLSWRAAAANDGHIHEDSTLDIHIETNDQEMRYFFQKIVIDFVEVSILSIHAIVEDSSLEIPRRRLYGQSRTGSRGTPMHPRTILRRGLTRIGVKCP